MFDNIIEISQRAHDEVLKEVPDIHQVDLHLELEEEDVQRVVQEGKEKREGEKGNVEKEMK